MARIVLVQPEFEINLGSVARAMKNFGFKELYLVRPKACIGLEARKFAKHSEDILANAKRVDSVEAATKGCFVVGTTGVVERFGKKLKTCVSLKEFVEKYPVDEKTAVLFGGESRGLDEKTLNECDLVVTIPTSRAHRVLNISHAVAIVLYEMREKKEGKKRALYKLAGKEKIATLEKMFSHAVDSLEGIRKKWKVKLAFKKIISRSRASEDEVQNLFAAFTRLVDEKRKKH